MAKGVDTGVDPDGAGRGEGAKRRGRPRAYDPETATLQALEAFWNTGFAATSLDDISAATGMNRPSLYAAFGDKEAIYLAALRQYWRAGHAGMEQALSSDRPLPEALMRVYKAALDLYFSGPGAARGCFAIGTATTEAVESPAIRALFAEGLAKLDQGFAARLRAAREEGELDPEADVEALAMLASATLHTIAIRARAGTPRAELTRLAKKAVATICRRTG